MGVLSEAHGGLPAPLFPPPPLPRRHSAPETLRDFRRCRRFCGRRKGMDRGQQHCVHPCYDALFCHCWHCTLLLRTTAPPHPGSLSPRTLRLTMCIGFAVPCFRQVYRTRFSTACEALRCVREEEGGGGVQMAAPRGVALYFVACACGHPGFQQLQQRPPLVAAACSMPLVF